MASNTAFLSNIKSVNSAVRGTTTSSVALNQFYKRQQIVNAGAALLLFLISEPLYVLPFLALGYALSYIYRRNAEAALLKANIRNDLSAGPKPFYTGKRFAKVIGTLAAFTIALGAEYYDRPRLTGEEADCSAEIDRSGKIRSIEVKVPVSDPLFNDPIRYEVAGYLKGKRVNLPFKVKKNVLTFSPVAENIRIEAFLHGESLGYIQLPDI